MIEPLHIIANLSNVCGDSGSCGLPTTHTDSAIQNVLTIVFGVVGALALLMIVMGGLRYITADGSPEKAAKARDSVIYALVGLTIALIAEAIVNFVINRL